MFARNLAKERYSDDDLRVSIQKKQKQEEEKRVTYLELNPQNNQSGLLASNLVGPTSFETEVACLGYPV